MMHTCVARVAHTCASPGTVSADALGSVVTAGGSSGNPTFERKPLPGLSAVKRKADRNPLNAPPLPSTSPRESVKDEGSQSGSERSRSKERKKDREKKKKKKEEESSSRSDSRGDSRAKESSRAKEEEKEEAKDEETKSDTELEDADILGESSLSPIRSKSTNKHRESVAVSELASVGSANSSKSSSNHSRKGGNSSVTASSRLSDSLDRARR